MQLIDSAVLQGDQNGPARTIWSKVRELRIPLSVHFDLTYRCPQRCVHCYLPESYRQGNGFQELQTFQIKEIIEELAANGTFFLTFSGGEIFLRPDLMSLVDYARSLNFSVSLMTSGIFGPSEDQIRILSSWGIEAIYISLHGLKEEWHDRITQVPGSWKRVIKTIRRCREIGLQVVLNSQALRLNFRGVPALREFAAREGFPLRVDDNLTPRWDGRPHTDGLALTEAESFWLRQETAGEDGSGITEPATVPFDSQEGGCKAGQTSCYINPLGEVMPCIELRWPLGCLQGCKRFIQIWEDSPILHWLRSFLHIDRDISEAFCVHIRKKGMVISRG